MNAREQFVYPRGWFVVAFADEITAGQLRSLEYFGKKLVAFRGEDGRVSVLDAHCPHLGADLTVGGRVQGCTVRCPFHAWRFDADGACVEVPYAEKIPPKAQLRAWPTVERNDLVYVYHDPAGGAPRWEVPTIENYGTEPWLRWKKSMVTVKTHPREIVENVADSAHFIPVHGTHVESFENIFEEHKATQISRGIAYPRGGGKDKFELRATYHGPGFQVTQMRGYLQSVLLNAHTPVNENTLDLRFAVSLKVVGDVATTESFAAQYIDNLRTGYMEDVAIWEHKQYRERPVLCDGDGPIGKLRKWYSQFYRATEVESTATSGG